MNDQIAQLSTAARQAVPQRNWLNVRLYASRILELDSSSAEGYFLLGLAERGTGNNARAAECFEHALASDGRRYDAAVELAGRYAVLSRQGDAAELLARFEPHLATSPLYLNRAGEIYVRIGLHQRAWPLYSKADELQPGVDMIQANRAECAVYLGKIEEAQVLYESLLARHPDHQRNHYELSRLRRASDTTHIDRMLELLERGNKPPRENIYLYYALGKEFEDLEHWEEAFEYYKRAGDAAAGVASYDVSPDVQLLEHIAETCTPAWFGKFPAASPGSADSKQPIFVVGLPRSGTTLTERILSSHSMVGTVDETFFMDVAIRRSCGEPPAGNMTEAIITQAVTADPNAIADSYLESVQYKCGEQPLFIDKLPANFNYLGFIAKAFPEGKIVHLRRNPVDVCFAMYKQPYFRFAFTLEDLAAYYIAFHRLRDHWRELLGERLIEVEYEALVSDQEAETRSLLDRLGLEFEAACLEFDRNVAPTSTASSVQVREKVHTRSVLNWRHFETQLTPLCERLQAAGIEFD